MVSTILRVSIPKLWVSCRFSLDQFWDTYFATASSWCFHAALPSSRSEVPTSVGRDQAMSCWIGLLSESFTWKWKTPCLSEKKKKLFQGPLFHHSFRECDWTKSTPCTIFGLPNSKGSKPRRLRSHARTPRVENTRETLPRTPWWFLPAASGVKSPVNSTTVFPSLGETPRTTWIYLSPLHWTTRK